MITIFILDYPSYAEVWIDEYEDETFEQQLKDILVQIKPLYEQLHAYVRHKLTQNYGECVVSKDGPIPMHLLGDVWADSWSNVSVHAMHSNH